MALSAEEKKTEDISNVKEEVAAKVAPKEEVKKEESQDAKINKVGAEAKTIAKPKPSVNVERAAILYLAKQVLTPADLEDFKTLYPSLFE